MHIWYRTFAAALIATAFHVVQRTSRARLAGQLSPWFVLLGYNLFCLLAVSGYHEVLLYSADGAVKKIFRPVVRVSVPVMRAITGIVALLLWPVIKLMPK